MKVSKNWLNEWVETELSVHQLADQLTMIGLAVDSVDSAAKHFSGVVVAKIESIEKHPNADKLNVCQVNIGKKESLTIVCGASNARSGIKVACAMIGAALPDDVQIKKTTLRGVESQGMLCSEKELGFTEVSQGIMELPNDAPVGQDFREYYQLNDEILEIDLTPNRGDCASHLGIAREIAAITNSAFHEKEIIPVKPSLKDEFPIQITAREACPRYVGRVIKQINSKAATPVWMQERLRRCGIRPLSPVVDVTNYVLLELGQPMHAFDLNQLSGEIQVRFANENEKLILLDKTEVELSKDTLIIADRKGPLAIAGVIGGLNSSVTDATKNIFLESAFFTPKNIANKARQYGVQTDSSYRFERGVDYQLQRKAIERATQLLLNIVGGEPGPITEREDEAYLPIIKPIKLHHEKITKLLGHEIPESTIENTLTSLGLTTTPSSRGHAVGSALPSSRGLTAGSIYPSSRGLTAGSASSSSRGLTAGSMALSVNIPSYRFDLRAEVDLIEEVARIYGYENIPARFYRADLHASKTSNKDIKIKEIRELFKAKNYNEVITYSFDDRDAQLLFDSSIEPKALLNPISKEMAVMRTSLWPSLIQTLNYNLHRQQHRIRLFEIGLRYREIDKKLHQERVVSGLIYGSANEEQWGEVQRPVDFYDLKSDLEGLLSLTNQPFEFLPAKQEALHPVQCSEMKLKGNGVGYCGKLHPTIVQQLKMKEAPFLFELLLDPLSSKTLPEYHEISKFPSIRRDIALLVGRSITNHQIESIIRRELGDLLTNFCIFDLFEGKEIEKNKKSVAYGLTLQHKSSTLIDSEINEIMNRVIQSLEQGVGAELRS